MTDQVPSNPQAATGQSQNASSTPAGEGGAAADQQKYLTVDGARALFAEEFRKSSQSTVDRVADRVQKIIQTAKEQGVTMTTQQAEAVLKVTETAAQQPNDQAAPASSRPAQAPTIPGQQPAPEGEAQPKQIDLSTLDPIDRKAVTILQKEFGLTDFDPDNVDEDEPEFKLLVMETDDPEEYLQSVRAYGKAKAERLGNAGDPAALPGLGSGGQVNPKPFEGMSGRDILNQAYQKR